MTEENEGFRLWRERLGCARYIVAPMVDQSELAWRILSRRHGAQLCYTPMLHASIFVKDLKYRKENVVSCDEDRPLIIQFCANDADVLVEASKLAVGHCEAVDLNLGCPQAIAKRGRYGAFLQDDWELLQTMVRRVRNEVAVPITCKIRIFNDLNRTVRYARMLEEAGCHLLTVHGRTKEQKGPHTGVASWKHIRAVREAVSIPIFANGNIQYFDDIKRCFLETGVEGVMSAEGNLHNPALFEGVRPFVWDVASEYLNLVKQYPCPTSFIRGHLFKLFHHCFLLTENQDLRSKLATTSSLEDFVNVTELLKSRYQNGNNTGTNGTVPWVCQPYVRPSPSEKTEKRRIDVPNDGLISKRKLKKLKKNPRIKFQEKTNKFENCDLCPNPKGMKCLFNLCRGCCRDKTFEQVLNCPGHKFIFKTKHERQENQSVSIR